MLPSILARQVRAGVEDQLRASFSPSTKAFENIIESFLDEPEALIKGPWLSLDMPFRRSERAEEFFPDVPLGFRPYRHQERAFERLSGIRPKSTLVATGTGSGKTECFLLPVLDSCAKAKGEPGIKAIIIYPMNALATDQARRIAKLIDKNPRLKGLRAGIYADERPQNASSVMTPTWIIDSRDALVKNPPDILLTNYKMLDYMLVRPEEREIWEKNRPDTLRHLIVDELHTFDGAQGTDLASLIRRLKDRLKMRSGDLCCVGTSATLGGPEAIEDLVAYAREIFDEPFDASSVVLEDRQSVNEYLEDIQITALDVPAEDQITALVRKTDDLTPEELVRLAFGFWLKAQPPRDVSATDWRVSLGHMLDGHVFFQTLLKILKGRPRSYTDIKEEFRRNKLYRGLGDDHLDALIDTLTALIAHARRIYPDAVDESGKPIPMPFFNVRHQLWLRELRRMVANVGTTPRLQHHDDLGFEEQQRALPVIHCRACGGAGWATVTPNDERRPLGAELQEVYSAYFGYSDRLRFIFRESPVPRIKRRVVGQTRSAWLCTECLVPHYGETCPEGGCGSCRASTDKLIEVFVHKPGRLTDEKFRVDHDCTFCGAPNGLGILGAQSVTLVTGMVATMFGSDHNDDPKLLTFSDSVQDAAHRAGVLQARNASNVFRAGLSRFVCEAVAPNMETVEAEAPKAMQKALGDKTPDGDFVATYLPADMEWRNDYKALLATDELPPGSKLPEYLQQRLAWESFAELTFRSRLGATVERTGLAAPHTDLSLVGPLCEEIAARMRNDLGMASDAISQEDLLRFLVGLLDHMRARGAVATDITRLYVAREANWYAVVRAHPHGRSLPQYAPAAPKPTFPSNRVLRGFEPVATDGIGGWYVPWFLKWFEHKLVLTGDLYRDFYNLMFKVLENRNLVERLPIGVGKDVAATCAWGLKPETVRVHAKSATVRCDTCGNLHHIPAAQEFVDVWTGMRCTRVGCEGSMGLDGDARRNRFRTRILTKGRIKRVIAAEHTGLLGREQRQEVERRFMTDDRKTWYPNLLAATPTLEMGINIGDLSTLVLCSVPPEQANYVQRIGRTGRRDGNSLNVTVATARPHDMWYWADPEEMISGKVRTPGVHLKAVAILKRQFAAYTLDRWVSEAGAGVKSYGKVRDALNAITAKNQNAFPLFWFKFVEEKAESLFNDFCRLFPRLLEDTEALEALRAFAFGGENDSLAYAVANEFAGVSAEISAIQERMDAASAMAKKLKAEQPPPTDLKERLDALDREKRALGMIKREINSGDIVGFLTDRGILPNYLFPEQGVTLKSILYRTEVASEEDKAPTITEYMRPAAAALGEFAPSALFYADSRKLKIDQIDLSASPIEHWRVCPDCTHMALAQAETTEEGCPCCGSKMWADKGARRPMIRLKQVYAVGNDRNTRIGDDGDERETRYFDRDYLPAFERNQIGNAYAVEDGALPFAFEHLRRCTFREVNFGENGDTPSGQKVAGERRLGHGFSLCRSCGRVQDPEEIRRMRRDGSKKGLHQPRCHEVNSEDDDTYVSVVYLYREFTSEAIRFLLPLASSKDHDKVKSLRAAMDLGLRLHFKGKVDHLRTSLVETADGPLTRRYLYLYDTVPGGTGYLKQLATRPDEMQDVFALALAHMRDCVCNTDPRKDGCPRCIRSHASTFGRGEVSRDTASGIIAEILADWDKLRPVDNVDGVKLNKALESELEAMFVARFRDNVQAAGGKFIKAVVNAQPGFFVKHGDGEWRLQPQVDLSKHFPGVPKTRADFVLWPAVPTPGSKPVAIYLDGWQWHHDRIPNDLRVRQELIRSGHVLVWSLTWADVETASGGEAKKHFWDPSSSLPGPMLNRLTDGEQTLTDLRAVLEAAPFDQFLRYVRCPDMTAWTGRACALSTGLFLSGMQAGKDPKAVMAATEEFSGDAGRATLEAMPGTPLYGYRLDKGVGCVTVAVEQPWRPPEWPQGRTLTTVVGFEHRLAESPEAKKAWNGALRLLNLLQFGGPLYVGCTEEIGLDPAPRPAPEQEDAYSEAWADVERLVLADLLPLVRKLRQKVPPVTPPEALYEVADAEGNAIGTLELAWPEQKKGIVLEPDLARLFPGWTIIVYAGQDNIFEDDPVGEPA
ncbi:DEAD/DEAH box helicase domain-containing protein [Microvirga lupini]|uniref:DEAD/DEAH box helicase domain-containing protein n=1 Tax=Microvirga lupini TaxID=420324 RepID=A0A7W4VNM9_9HYPH|nr:DEAD/DEAH box helicase [Microvirga lupini]MBB3020411.1 DEAD/DEAH box helicase domain-containing protein [Microvirga lupini]